MGYAETAANASATIKRKGVPIKLTRAAGDYNPATSEVESSPRSFNGFAVRTDEVLKEFEGLVEAGDAGFLFAVDGIPQPKPGDRFEFDKEYWRVQECKPVKPATVAIVYQVQARK
jgi:hypothetical protein